ncbi:hypothetical protein [Leekyejoonella antrihumi]|uniref:Uncharacterized protein n=1 Tax=Leekyejoonella antrihumi TaxID=1660198 RepID=A0A563E067_9MICO|nr:hypothetical protein [Leekyejoonella antrihumi]TWP35907.1 hypothetical protein FGL98_11770 [Leekyejoonella antrihumi]
MVRAHADTYYYLIWDRVPGTTRSNPEISQESWNNLPEFADKAARMGVSVIVYLVPPSETVRQNYKPFGWDYSRWFRAVGRIAARHTSIVGVAMDDIASNLVIPGTVTPEQHKFTVRGLEAAMTDARATAPWLKFFAVLYARDILGPGSVIPYLRTVLNGVIYPFAGPDQVHGAPQNTTDPSGVLSSVKRVRASTSCVEGSCWEVHIGRAAVSGATASMAKTISVGGSDTIRIYYSDDRTVPSQGTYTLSLNLDGQPVMLSRGPDVRGMHSARATLRLGVVKKGGRLRLTVRRSHGVERLTVVVNGLSIDHRGRSTTVDLTRGASRSAPSSGVDSQFVHPLKLISMYYCAPFGAEDHTPGAAGFTYVESVLGQMVGALKDQDIDGLVAYRLDLRRGPQTAGVAETSTFGLVQRTYASLVKYRAIAESR